MSIVVGVDLSLTSTGICRITSGAIDLHRVKTKGGKDDSLALRSRRITALAVEVRQLANGGGLVVLESPSLGQSRQAGEHLRAGLWWRLVGLLFESGHQVAEVSPAALKKYATGKGNAGKDEVLAAVVRRYPQAEVTGNDAADALVLAAMGARHMGEPVEESLAKVNLTAMEAVRWPQ